MKNDKKKNDKSEKDMPKVGANELRKELNELIEEGETRTEAYRKIMKEIEKGITEKED